VSALTTIGFDADDTLWHNERVFRLTEQRFAALLGDHAPAEDVSRRLLEAERRNLRLYGYGIKGFTLSMIETALEVTGGKVPTAAIREILDAGRDMMSHPVEVFPQVRETLEALRQAWPSCSTPSRSSATRMPPPIAACSPATATGRSAP
jgi:putative hydrolase of the HAD superfamily